MNKKKALIPFGALATALWAAGCQTTSPPPQAPAATTEAGWAGRWVNLEQGWSPETRQQFWFTDQGSEIIPYAWFLAVEQAHGTELLRSDANIMRLGYLPEGASSYNPDGLPVGFAKAVARKDGKEWFGLTCAACHTGQVNYRGASIRIDGGQTLGDFNGFLDDLVAGLRATRDDEAKFQRFAGRVLGDQASPAQLAELRDALAAQVQKLDDRIALNLPPNPAGHGRVDAFGNIFNEVFAVGLGIPANAVPPSAPVSYPFLWDTPQHDLVQWNGAAPNAGVGPLLRNVGEALGVFGTVKIEPEPWRKGYPSSINIGNLGKLESWLVGLQSPQWPQQYLPAVDSAKAERGKTHYQAYCVQCHALIDRKDPTRRITAVMTPVASVGTDPAMARNAAERMAKTGKLQGTREMIFFGKRFGPEAPGTKVGPAVAAAVALGQPFATLKAGLREYLLVRNAARFDPLSYKARPLNGIWATAPYLHNGSVPNLWQLLQPAAQRDKAFYVGSYEFDPRSVGFVNRPDSGQFKYDTALPGNANGGHEYGTRELTEEQKWELLEYLKTL